MIPRNGSTFWNLALIISFLEIGQQDESPQIDESPKLMVSDPLKFMISPCSGGQIPTFLVGENHLEPY
jgi:hypothetical protein